MKVRKISKKRENIYKKIKRLEEGRKERGRGEGRDGTEGGWRKETYSRDKK